jgi:hypothetical protein
MIKIKPLRSTAMQPLAASSRESMIERKQLRLVATRPLAAQSHSLDILCVVQ